MIKKKMKWGRKISGASLGSVILSWLFKLGQRRGRNSDESKSIRDDGLLYANRGKSIPGGGKEGKFYRMSEDDAYWRISFRQERRSNTGEVNTNTLSDPEFQVPISDFRFQNFDDMVSDLKKMKEQEGKDKTAPRSDNNGIKIQKPNVSLSSVKEKQSKMLNVGLSSVKEDYALENCKKLKEIKTKSDHHLYKKVTTQRRNSVKAYYHLSPRTECRIRAIEEIKKSRLKCRKKNKKTAYDTFAVVKTSSNPKWDFWDSMTEMIREKGISRTQDLEDLLACYLAFNCEKYHDLIIKVFRQVWSELDIDTRIQNSQCVV